MSPRETRTVDCTMKHEAIVPTQDIKLTLHTGHVCIYTRRFRDPAERTLDSGAPDQPQFTNKHKQ